MRVLVLSTCVRACEGTASRRERLAHQSLYFRCTSPFSSTASSHTHIKQEDAIEAKRQEREVKMKRKQGRDSSDKVCMSAAGMNV